MVLGFRADHRPQEALKLAWAKGLTRWLFNPKLEHISRHTQLMKALEAASELDGYIFAIQQDSLLLEDYHDNAIRDWVANHHNDPVTIDPRTIEDIKADPKVRGLVGNQIFSFCIWN